MAYVPVPKDLSRVKNKIVFNLTKRQLICLLPTAVIGVALYFLVRDALGVTNAATVMVLAMLPGFLFGLYEKDGMYYSVDINLLPYTGEPQTIFGTSMVLHEGAPRDYPCLIQRLGSWDGFMALWAGVATPDQARRMVRENLLDTRTWCAAYGVRTLSRLEPMYNLRPTHNPSNWQGPVWGISNYMVWRGLVDYGMVRECGADPAEFLCLLFRLLPERGERDSVHAIYGGRVPGRTAVCSQAG